MFESYSSRRLYNDKLLASPTNQNVNQRIYQSDPLKNQFRSIGRYFLTDQQLEKFSMTETSKTNLVI